MPNRLRFLSNLAICAAALAACTGRASPSPTTVGSLTSPTVEGSPRSLPSATTAASASPAPTLTPGCLGIDELDVINAEVMLGSVDEAGNGGGNGFSVGHVASQMRLTRIDELSGNKRSIDVPPGDVEPGRDQVLGGVEFITFPATWFEGHVGPQSMISAKVTLTLDGGAPIDLPTRVVPGNENFDQVAVSVPDVSGPGRLALDFVWADACFRYAGSLTTAVDVVPRSMTKGCALEANAYFDQVEALVDRSIRVETSRPRAGSPFNESKFIPWSNPGIDAFLLYSFDKDDAAIVAAPGAALRVEQATSELRLADEITVEVWTRASVARAVTDYPPDGSVTVLSRTPTKQADGSFRLRVPSEPGRYVAGVAATYDSHCSSGTIWLAVNIDVVAPAAAT